MNFVIETLRQKRLSGNTSLDNYKHAAATLQSGTWTLKGARGVQLDA